MSALPLRPDMLSVGIVYDDASFHLTSLPPGARDDWPARRLPRPPCSQSTSPRKVCHARLGSQELPASVTPLARAVGRPSADADEAYGQEQQPQVWCPSTVSFPRTVPRIPACACELQRVSQWHSPSRIERWLQALAAPERRSAFPR